MDIKDLLDWGLNPNFITPEFLATHGLSASAPWRFISKVRKTNSCWLWTGCVGDDGYGRLRRGPNAKPMFIASRLSWFLHFGPPPEDIPCVLHNCPGGDNRGCVNPIHLWCGTRGENNTDMFQKGRGCFGENHYRHKLTALQVVEIWRSVQLGGTSRRLIALKYGVSKYAVYCIASGKTWKNVLAPLGVRA